MQLIIYWVQGIEGFDNMVSISDSSDFILIEGDISKFTNRFNA